MTRTRLLFSAGALLLTALVACKDSSPTQSINTDTTTPKKANIRIVELMPNPSGSDDYTEWFRLKNLGDTAGSLAGWKIIDNEHTIWSLDTIGTLQPGIDYKLVSPYHAELNNNGDTLALYNAAGTAVQWILYGKTTDGTSIVVP